MNYTLPLLYDHHTHPTLYAALQNSPNIYTANNKELAMKRIKENCKREINLVLGWNDSRYHFAKSELENLPPVIIMNLSLHGFLLNSAAKEYVSNINPQIAEYLNDKIKVERNLTKIISFFASLQPFTIELLEKYFSQLLQVGIWYAEDLYVSSAAVVEQVANSTLANRTAFWTDYETHNSFAPEIQKHIKGLKVFTDGAFGTKTAALQGKYRNGGSGVLIYSERELYDNLKKAAAVGKPIAVHAIGNAATRQVVDCFKYLKEEKVKFDARIEHCQLISREKARTAKDIGLKLSMQPNFSIEAIEYADRLHTYDLENNNAFRMLIDEIGFVAGKDLFFGSDGMPHGAEFALQQAFFPTYEKQKIRKEEFMDGYCIDNYTHGEISVEIDETERRVNTTVSINKC